MFSKASQIILAREQGELDAVDRKIFNFLLNRVRSEVRPGESVIHRVPVADVLEFIGHSSTDRLRESLARLGSVDILIDYVDEDKVENSAKAHYLSYNMAMAVDGWIHFAFDPILVEFIDNPKVFATLSLDLTRRFRSAYAAKLYEVMSLYVHRSHQVWMPTVDEFREIMKVDDSYGRFDNLRKRVIEAAVDEVNEISPFLTEVEYVRTGKGGKVSALRFSVSPKGPKTLLELRSVADPLGRGRRNGGSRDPNTPDLLDGKTDAERGHCVVSDDAIRRAIQMIPADTSVDVYLEQWREGMRGRLVRDADRSFLGWLDMRVSKEQNEAMGLVDDDTIETLLEKWECAR
jgi:hypothetical protein